MSKAVVELDPYREWLNVTEKSRPLNPYQLLGLNPLEHEQGRIDAAIKRQRLQLETHLTAANPELWDQVRKELEAAIEVLQDPDRKSLLDAGLKRRAALTGAGAAGAGPLNRSGTVPCRQCAHVNDANRRFCVQCGSSLWEKCTQCGTEIAAHERFCGHCGTDIRGTLEQQQQEFDRQIDAALKLAAEHRYEQALEELRSVARCEDPRFDRWAQKAVSLIAKVNHKRAAVLAAAERSLQHARQYLQNYAYEKALIALEEIPERVRTDEMNLAREGALAARNEVLNLGGEIRDAVENKQTRDLLPKLQRLLALKPDHAKAAALAKQLQERFIHTARQHLAKHEYAEAIADLEQIPDTLRTEDVASLQDKAAELYALFEDLRLSPLADETTEALARRFLKLAPTNAAAAKLMEQFLEKRKARPASPRLVASDWAPLPRRTPLGLPVDWLGFFTRLKSDDEAVQETLRANPGRFFVALGLALQGVGQAAIDVSLMPEEKRSMLAKLSFSFGRRGPLTAWGLDLSDSGLKAIKLRYDSKTKKLELLAAECLPHSKPLSTPDAEMERSAIAVATLKRFLEKHKVDDDRLCGAVPSQRVLGRFFEAPPLPAKKVLAAIQYETRHQIPIAVEELIWAHKILDEADAKTADAQPRRVMVVAAREYHVKERLALFKEAGLELDIVQSEALALHNALVHEFFEDEAFRHSREGALAVVDVGADSTNVVISTPRCVWFRNVGLAGNDFNAALVKQFKLTFEQAEQVKQEPARARRLSQLHEQWQPLLVQMTSEIERSLTTYQRLYENHEVGQVFGLGGGFRVHGLLRQLRQGR